MTALTRQQAAEAATRHLALKAKMVQVDPAQMQPQPTSRARRQMLDLPENAWSVDTEYRLSPRHAWVAVTVVVLNEYGDCVSA